MNFSSVHIFRLVQIFRSDIFWRFITYRGVFTNNEIIHNSGRWQVGLIDLAHKCKPRGVRMLVVKISLKR